MIELILIVFAMGVFAAVTRRRIILSVIVAIAATAIVAAALFLAGFHAKMIWIGAAVGSLAAVLILVRRKKVTPVNQHLFTATPARARAGTPIAVPGKVAPRPVLRMVPTDRDQSAGP